jgi:hypothetical protein
VKPVKHINPSPNNLSGTGWRILGELELTTAAEADGLISTWLAKTLNPFKLPADFLSRVKKSAQDATIRAITSEGARMKFEHLHLRVFAPRKDEARFRKGQTWGFFRIEKVGTLTENGDPHDHSIEFYLYLEG